MEFKKILVPLNGSGESRRAVTPAIYLAETCQARIDILHVIDLNKHISAFEQVSTGGYVPFEIKEEGYKLLAEIMHDIPREVQAKAIVEIGAPPQTIIDVCEQGSYDLIIMGSRGLGKLEQIVVGSVSQYVLHHAPCPVLVAR